MKYKCSMCGEPTNNLEIIAGQDITWCDKCKEKHDKEFDYQYENEKYEEATIICPHCNYEYEDYETYRFDEGSEEKVQCISCGRKFDLEVENTRTYNTKRSVCEMESEVEE